VEVPESVSSGSYELAMRLEALEIMGTWEAVPFWSVAGWEETLDLGTIEVSEP
jgi:hypothetical protein